MTTQHGHEGRHHGIGTPDCPLDLHHHHDERCSPPGADALADRRQRAREAFHDEWSRRDKPTMSAVNEAIETATRVRVDGQLMAHVFPLVERKIGLRDAEQLIAAAFRAAGFEVEE